MMEIHNLVQGTPEWHAHRDTHRNASEAAAMLGLCKKVTRDELVRMKATGTEREFSDWVQENILDKGHRNEAAARPIMEQIMGEDLFPVTGSAGIYSASFDGLTMAEEVGWEHKQWNEDLAALVKQGIIPDTHMPQVQQQLMIGELHKVIFTVSDGTAEKMVYTEVLPDPAWFERLVLGWEQFDKDVANYVPAEVKEKPVAEAIKALPTLVIQLQGAVVSSNLPLFKQVADNFIANIKTELETDQDFADAEAMVKFLKEGEDSLENAKTAALGQTASIDELMRTIDHIKNTMRGKRLVLDKVVTSEKESRRLEILDRGRREWAVHVAGLEVEIQPIKLGLPVPDFATAMKGKKTITSLNNAVNTLLANSKIEADKLGKELRAKLVWIKEAHPDHGFLFRDLQQIITKPEEDFHLLVNTRVKEHEQAEAAKLEAERERIRQEEEARATAKAEAEAAAAKSAAPVVSAPTAQPQAVAQPIQAVIAPANDDQVKTAAPSPMIDDGSTMKLGDIARLLGFSLTEQFLADMGIQPTGRERNAVLYRSADFPHLCQCLISNINAASVDFIEGQNRERKAA
jgi:predicted phage-related endonuclease